MGKAARILNEEKESVLIYDGIIESHEAEEMAKGNNYNDVADALSSWIEEVGTDGEWNESEMPKYKKFVASTPSGYDVYYDYGADYYFFVKNGGKLAESKKRKNTVKLTESNLKGMVKTALRESIAAIYWGEFSNILEKYGYSYVDVHDGTFHGQKAMRVVLTANGKDADFEGMKAELTRLFGEDNISFGRTHHKYAPEIVYPYVIITEYDSRD